MLKEIIVGANMAVIPPNCKPIVEKVKYKVCKKVIVKDNKKICIKTESRILETKGLSCDTNVKI